MTQAAIKCFFEIHEVVVLTGFTKYMLDYLAREDIFRAGGVEYGTRGRRRKYTYEDVVLLKALNRICGARGKIRNLKASLAALRSEVGPLLPGQRLEKIFFLDGNELSLWTGKDTGRHLRSGQMTFAFVLDLRSVSEELGRIVKFDAKNNRVTLNEEVVAHAESVRQTIWQRVQNHRARQG
jgi:hypothetical protein